MIEHAALLRAAANQIDELDAQIAALNDDKKLVYQNAKETVAPADFKAWRDAVKLRQRRRVDRDAMEAHDARVWSMVSMLEAETVQTGDEASAAPVERAGNSLPDGNPSHVRAHEPPHDAETGELITETEPPASSLVAPEQAGAGLSPRPPAPAAPRRLEAVA